MKSELVTGQDKERGVGYLTRVGNKTRLLGETVKDEMVIG